MIGRGEKRRASPEGTGTSALVKMLLEKGYAVKTIVRNPDDMEKNSHLKDLQALGPLEVFRADLKEEGSFDDAVAGCDYAFLVATPVNLNTENPEVDCCLVLQVERSLDLEAPWWWGGDDLLEAWRRSTELLLRQLPTCWFSYGKRGDCSGDGKRQLRQIAPAAGSPSSSVAMRLLGRWEAAADGRLGTSGGNLLLLAIDFELQRVSL